MTDPGVLYVLTNPSMPGLVKIGITKGTVEKRITGLSGGTGVPMPFECHFAARVPSLYKAKEQLLQGIFAPDRVNKHREFFKVDPERVVMAIKMGEYTEVTPGKPAFAPEEQRALEKANKEELKKAAAFTFDSVGIKEGSLLRFTRDQSLTAIVEPNNEVLFSGKNRSISDAARLALKVKYPVRGPQYWLYDGETLTERYRRLHR